MPVKYSLDLLSLDKILTQNETENIDFLLKKNQLTLRDREQILEKARRYASDIRGNDKYFSGIDSFLSEYGLSTDEGIVLMCLAEALLRVPDAQTKDDLIKDKLLSGDWHSHLNKSDSLFVNASTWALMLTGKVLEQGRNYKPTLNKLFSRSSEPVIRKAVVQSMNIMGKQFVMGESIEKTVRQSETGQYKKLRKKGYCFSYDMLGEAALTEKDAEKYFKSYENAILNTAKVKNKRDSVSIKLSALYPKYLYTHFDQAHKVLTDKLLCLVKLARESGICITVDAEEADRLTLSLAIFESVFTHDDLKGWNGLGLAVQAYQKRAYYVLNYLKKLAEDNKKIIPVRLVKGAYWDSEIKWAQELGIEDYPVFTRKENTDVSYLVCAQFLLDNRQTFFPQFATHNAHTIATILHFSKDHKGFEFQRLFGMGELLYERVVDPSQYNISCRIYAPVGGYKDLLAYLVRRLLENGANTSFVNMVSDKNKAVDDIVSDPFNKVEMNENKAHHRILKPENLFTDRKNSAGVCLYNLNIQEKLNEELEKIKQDNIVLKNSYDYSPADLKLPLPCVQKTEVESIDKLFQMAKSGLIEWRKVSTEERAEKLNSLADLLEGNMARFIGLLNVEAGKTIQDGIAEVREAIDFLRYYSQQAKQNFSVSTILPGPTGESNQLIYEPRGVFVCISPWNFPLAIFVGQIAAALVTGNCVIAKPAEQTPRIADAFFALTKDNHIFPDNVLQIVHGLGEDVGDALVRHKDVSGIAFTGSFEVAKLIQRRLADKSGPIIPFIAETGGINAMIVDSTALLEQVTKDVITSSFQSAGQRCSALRLICIQEDVKEEFIDMLKGAMDHLSIGKPWRLNTDLGPVIDRAAFQHLNEYIKKSHKELNYLHSVMIPEGLDGHYIEPHLFEINSITQMGQEVFGPVLHLYSYKAKELDALIEEINALGYGLTFGIHSRIHSKIERVAEKIQVGNVYVNRNIIGAVVGVQPFGGEGYSGTGPKAGGPNYLYRFVNEKTITINTTASGGNASLLSIEDDS